MVRYEDSTKEDNDIWGLHESGLFEEMDHTGTTWYIDASLPKKNEFDVWYCDWQAEDECEVGSTTYTLDWNSVFVNKLGGDIPFWHQALENIDIAGKLSGSTIKVYDYDF